MLRIGYVRLRDADDSAAEYGRPEGPGLPGGAGRGAGARAATTSRRCTRSSTSSATATSWWSAAWSTWAPAAGPCCESLERLEPAGASLHIVEPELCSAARAAGAARGARGGGRGRARRRAGSPPGRRPGNPRPAAGRRRARRDRPPPRRLADDRLAQAEGHGRLPRPPPAWRSSAFTQRDQWPTDSAAVRQCQSQAASGAWRARETPR